MVAFSKQNMVETGTYGSELLAMSVVRGLIVVLRINLNLIGMPSTRPPNCFCDKNSIVKNTSIPELTFLNNYSCQLQCGKEMCSSRGHEGCKHGHFDQPG